MLLKMTTSMSGPGVSLSRDDPYECTDPREGVRLVDAGFAVAGDADTRAELDATRAVMAEEAAAAAAAAEIEDALDEVSAAETPVEATEEAAIDQPETPPIDEPATPPAAAAPKPRVTKPKAPKA